MCSTIPCAGRCADRPLHLMPPHQRPAAGLSFQKAKPGHLTPAEPPGTPLPWEQNPTPSPNTVHSARNTGPSLTQVSDPRSPPRGASPSTWGSPLSRPPPPLRSGRSSLHQTCVVCMCVHARRWEDPLPQNARSTRAGSQGGFVHCSVPGPTTVPDSEGSTHVCAMDERVKPRNNLRAGV